MSEPSPRSKRSDKPGLRALACCGDGFWECDLSDGSAWFSDWFYRKLGWAAEVRRGALHELRTALDPADWELFMRRFRAHLEQGHPFEVCLAVITAAGQRERWQFRGSAGRSDAGLPLYMAGNARELTRSEASTFSCPCGAFEALPVAAALLDAAGRVLCTNARWETLSPGPTVGLEQQIRAAEGRTDLTLQWHDVGTRTLTGRARRYDRAGTALWVAVLEEG